jgi:hypothetical protein
MIRSFLEILSNCVSHFPEFPEIDPIIFCNPQLAARSFSGSSARGWKFSKKSAGGCMSYRALETDQ